VKYKLHPFVILEYCYLSHDSMCVKWGLEWDSDKADVHSVHFSVGIARMELIFHNSSVILELVPSTVIFGTELSC
jgi:hypothetical protein